MHVIWDNSEAKRWYMRGDIHRFVQWVSFSGRLRADERYKSSSNKKTDTVMGCNDVDNIRWMLVWVYSV